MQDLTRIVVMVHFDDGAGHEERYRVSLTPVFNSDGTVKFTSSSVTTKSLPHVMTWHAAHMMCARLNLVESFVLDKLLSPAALVDEVE